MGKAGKGAVLAGGVWATLVAPGPCQGMFQAVALASPHLFLISSLAFCSMSSFSFFAHVAVGAEEV